IIAIFIGGQRRNQGHGTSTIEPGEQSPLQCFADQQRPIDSQIREPASSFSHLFRSKVEISKVIQYASTTLEWFPNFAAQPIDFFLCALDSGAFRLQRPQQLMR